MTGILLAGGESKRFGSPKAFATKDGQPFYKYSIHAIKPFVTKLFIVTNPKLEPQFKHEREANVITDVQEYQGHGPLAGIYSAMEQDTTDWYIVTPIDVPFINKQVIQQLVEHTYTKADAIIPIVTGKKQPLISIYHRSIKNVVKQHLDQNMRSVHQLLEALNVKSVTIDASQPFININQRSDYEKYIK